MKFKQIKFLKDRCYRSIVIELVHNSLNTFCVKRNGRLTDVFCVRNIGNSNEVFVVIISFRYKYFICYYSEMKSNDV